MNQYYEKKKHLRGVCQLLSFCMLFSAFSIGTVSTAVGQTTEKRSTAKEVITVKGSVYDEEGETVVGAAVALKGKATGTITDLNGDFTLSASPGDILVISFLGLKTEEVRVDGKKPIRVTLNSKSESLDQVVVIGYQSVTKKNIHGAVTSIRTEDMKAVTAPSIDAMLQGMVPGLNIQMTSGEPGGRNTFNVRGNNSVLDKDAISSPLFVLDGVPVDASIVGYSASSTNFLTNINPADIESIDILKDASSASIYGSRAANGVVLIKTKRGKQGKTKISFNGRYGIAMKPVLPKVYTGAEERRRRLEMLGANSTWLSQSQLPLVLTDSLNPAFNNNQDWYDLFYREAATQDYNVALSGGSESMSYRIGGGYFDQQGTMKGTGFSRFSFTGNVVNNIGKRLSFNTNVSYSLASRQALPNNAVTEAINTGFGDMPSSLLYLSETDKLRYVGGYTSVRNDNSDETVRLSEFINLRVFDWLTLSSLSSYDSYNSRVDRFSPASISSIGRSEASAESNRAVALNFENYLNFDKEFNHHHLTGVAGISASKTQNYGSYAGGAYIPSDLIQVVSGVPQAYKDARSDFYETSMVGLFARAQYYYKDRYSIFGSVRRDGSSRFAKNQRWGLFPSFGAFWTLSDEPFMKNIKKTLSFAKFRISYGQSGKQPEGNPYGYYSRYEVAGTYDGETAITPKFFDGAAQRNLTWEGTEELNVGLDLEFLNGRFFFQTDFYNKDINDLFFTLNMPNTSGYDVFNTNAVGVRNRGVEFMLRSNILPPSMKDWNWSVTLTAAYNKNMITKLPFGNRSIIVDGNRSLTVGRPINQFFLGIYDGVYGTDADVPINPYTGEVYVAENGKPYKAGDAILRDIDGNYKWVSYQDKAPVGDPNPKWTGGLFTSLTWKDLTLDINCSFTAKRDVMNMSLARTLAALNTPYGANEEGVGFSTYGYNTHWAGPQDFASRRMMVYIDDLDFWTRPGDVAQYPNLSMYREVANFMPNTTMFLENGSYFKVNSMMLSYRVPGLRKWNIDNLRVSVTAENLFIITAKGSHIPDPQNVSPDGYYTGNGYGVPRLVTFGVQLDF